MFALLAVIARTTVLSHDPPLFGTYVDNDSVVGFGASAHVVKGGLMAGWGNSPHDLNVHDCGPLANDCHAPAVPEGTPDRGDYYARHAGPLGR
mmetsp:Transcript_57759/g.118194  ORF Transcript_57759/g.118194 Transcript_57759/m.118194 type:complete len:93 (-) Transcript_57759:133-411(-)